MTLSGTSALTTPQNYLLWKVAQHKHGWTHVSRHRGQIQVAQALRRRGLVKWGDRSHDHPDPWIAVTPAGREFIALAWPNSPLNLDTYATPEGGWDKP